jgi:myosin heavy subunit
MEQEEYEREGIDWSYIEFIDNQDMLDVIERRSNGIISLLDESCMLASSTDEQFAQKLYTGLKDEQRLSKPKLSQTAFTLSHYAGDVTYESNTFLDKNKDFVIQEHEEILASGSHEELVRMFALGDDSSETSGRGKSSTKFSSVSTRFKKQLGELMSKLNATEPHYIRCIKPNAASKASSFEGANVLQQLRCGGVLEAIRISCAGYPSRKPIEIFLARFGLLAPQAAALYFEGREREALEGILQAANVDGWQIGKTQVFLRSGQMAILDVLRLNKLNKAAIEIQSRARAFVKRKQFTELRSASIKVAAAARGMLARKRVRSIREQIAAVRIQTAFRAIRARVQFERTKDAVQKIQAIVRGA